MKAYRELTRAERQTEYAAVRAAYDNQKAQGLKLNMARGKPGRDQLDLVTPMLSLITRPEDFGADGIEERNYGEVAGLPRRRRSLPRFWAVRASRFLSAATPVSS